MSIKFLSGVNVDSNTLVVDAANDRVGIGTASPAYTLDINGVTRFQDIVRFKNGVWNLSDEGNNRFFFSNSGRTYFGSGGGYEWRKDNDTAIAVLTNDGNVGIGTTAPSSLLSLSKTGLVDFQLNASDQATDEKTWVWQAGAPVGAGVYRLRAVNDAYTNGVNAVTFTRSGISSVTATFSSSVEATSFIKTSGTAAQYLMADGSVSTLTNPITGTGTTNYVPKFTSASAIGNSQIFDDGTNVGIGTTNPTSKLQVNGQFRQLYSRAFIANPLDTDGYAGHIIVNSNNANGDLAGIGLYTNSSYNAAAGLFALQESSTAASMVFYTGSNLGTEKMRITSGGNVGIGTTAPGARLDVRLDDGVASGEHNVLASFSRNGINPLVLGYRANGTSVTSTLIRSGDGTPITLGTTSANQALTIIDSGNVGIGTAGPTEKLHVDGSTLITYNNSFQSTNSVGNKAILARVSPTSGIINYAEYATAANLNGFVIGSDDARVKGNITGDSLEFITNTSTRMTILSGGNVGINTTTPGSTLHVVGDVLIQTGALGVGVNPSATDGRIDAGNDIVAFSTSDKRLKENITPITNALEKVKSLTGVEFDWKEETKSVHGYEGHDVGVIAQDVQAVLPEAVRINDSGYLSVRYEKMIALLIEANKELANRVEQLEKLIK